MPQLPSDDAFNNPLRKQSEFRAATAGLLSYLRGLLGVDGTVASARAILGLTGQPAAYINRGAWTSGGTYSTNDYVTNSGNTYLCVNPVSGSTTAPASDTVNWSLWQGVTLGTLQGTGGGQGASIVGWSNGGSGSSARTVDSKLDESVSVIDFGADPTGVASSSTAFTNARAASRYPYVPAGTYNMAQGFLPEGFWGPGKVLVNGFEYALPKSSVINSRVRTILSKFNRSAWQGAVLGLVGDSISEGYFTTTINDTWFNKLQRMLNASSSASSSDCEITNFADPSRYGITISGSTAVGSTGPVKRSLIMQNGASVTVPGGRVINFIDAVYDQVAGGGNLVIAKNGTALKTVSTAGSVKDVSTFSTATNSSTASDVYTFTASGGPVTLTGIWKLFQTSNPALFFSRMALSGQSTQLFSEDAVIASTIKHMQSLPGNSGRGIIFCALCVNNANTDVPTAGTTPAVYEQQLGKLFSRWLNAGLYVVAIGGIQPGNSYPTVRTNYPGIIATQRKVCEDYGVPLITMDAVDFLNYPGSLSDTLHPTDLGNDLMLEVITEFLASDAFDPSSGGKQASSILYSYSPQFEWFNSASGVAAASATANARYTRQGPLCKVIANLNSASGGTAANGPLCVTLPFIASTTVRCSGVVAQTIGFTTASNNKMWTIEAIANTNRATLRSYDPATGGMAEVTSIPNGATLDFAIDYIIQE